MGKVAQKRSRSEGARLRRGVAGIRSCNSLSTLPAEWIWHSLLCRPERANANAKSKTPLEIYIS